MAVRNINDINPDKIAIYVRWSTDDQGDGTTLQVQLEDCKHYILSQGWNINEKLILIDEGWSGGNLDRPGMTKLRELVLNDQINCVVVFKLDRLSRSVIDTVNLVLEEWEDICHVKSAREPVDTTSPMGKQFFYMLVSYAEWERSIIKERTWSGKLKRAEQGKNAGFKAPYGYNSENGVFIIIPDEAKIIKQIFNYYISGMGMQAITYKLNADGIKFRKGKIWNDSTISHILSNPIYIGKLVYGKLKRNSKRRKKGIVEPFWIRNNNPLVEMEQSEFIPAIISNEIFDEVTKIRESKNAKKSSISVRSTSTPHLLSGILKCTCGHSYTGDKKKGTNNYAYYRCRGANTKGKEFCNAGTIRQNEIDEIVVKRMMNRYLKENGRNELLSMMNDQHKEELSYIKQIINNLEIETKNLENELTRVEDDYRKGKNKSVDRYNKLCDKIEEEIKIATIKLEKSIEEFNELNKKIIDENEVDQLLSTLQQWDSLPISDKKIVLHKWIIKVTAFKEKGKDKKVQTKITWKR